MRASRRGARAGLAGEDTRNLALLARLLLGVLQPELQVLLELRESDRSFLSAGVELRGVRLALGVALELVPIGALPPADAHEAIFATCGDLEREPRDFMDGGNDTMAVFPLAIVGSVGVG